MFGIGSTELVVILIVALVLIGPSKLPDLMKSVGKGIAEFRRMSSDVKSTIEREIERADEAKRVEETKKELFGDGEQAKTEEPAAPETAAQAAPAGAETAASPAASETADAAAPVTGEAGQASSEKTPEAAPAQAEAGKKQEKSHA